MLSVKMRRRAATLGAGFTVTVAAAIVMAVSTFAASSATVTIDPNAPLGANGSSVTVGGTVNCTYPKLGALTGNITDTDTLTVSVSQRVRNGVASGSMTEAGPACDGATHAWTATVPDSNDIRFKTGQATATAYYTATAFASGGVETDQNSGNASRTITICSPQGGSCEP